MYKWLDEQACVTTNDGTLVPLANVVADELVDTLSDGYELGQQKLDKIEGTEVTKGSRIQFKSGRVLTVPNTAKLLGVLEKHWTRQLEVGMPIAMIDEVFNLDEEELDCTAETVHQGVEVFLESGEVIEPLRSIAGRRRILKELIASRGWLYGNKWAKSQHHIEYAMTTPNRIVARQMQQLFLQFGMHAIVRKRHVNQHIRYIVSVHGTYEMKLLFEQFDLQLRGKKNYEMVKGLVSIMRPIEVYPIEMSQKIEEVRIKRGTKRSSMVIKETGHERYRPKTTHRREHLRHFAKVLDMPELEQIANATIRFDRIVSIEKVKFDGVQVDTKSGYLIMNGVVVC